MGTPALLLILGTGADPDSICKAIAADREVAVFPLTSAYNELSAVRDRLAARGIKRVSVVPSARLADGETNLLRTNLLPWLAGIAERRVDGTALKDYLSLPGLSLSAWWLGLIAERNTLKTSAFLRFAQVRAIASLLAGGGYDRCLIAVEEAPASAAIVACCQDAGVAARTIQPRSGQSFAVRLKRRLREGGLLAHQLSGFLAWLMLCRRVWRARRILGPPVSQMRESGSLLFVSYFPSYDQAAARRGEFRNKYALPLQDLLRSCGRPIQWLLMYADLNGASYRDAVEAARHFASGGEPVVMIDQFGNWRDCWRVLGLFLRLGGRIERAYAQVGGLAASPLPAAVEPLWRNLWYEALGDREMVYGLYYAIVFRRATAVLAEKSTACLYFCEMQAWEKALCRACSELEPPLRTIGFQHSSTPANFWPYLIQPMEAVHHGNRTDIPLPDILAVGGKVAGYPLVALASRLVEVEAIRYLYLARRPSTAASKSTKPTLLVAGSIDRTESLALLHLLLAMGPPPASMRMLLKGHPSMPFAPLLAELTGNNDLPAGFELSDDDLYSALDHSWAALVSASTVALEALAYGCRILLPLFPDAMQMNPVADFPDRCEIIATPDELRTALAAVVDAGPPDDDAIGAGHAFVGRYWNLDAALPAWRSLLGTANEMNP